MVQKWLKKAGNQRLFTLFVNNQSHRNCREDLSSSGRRAGEHHLFSSSIGLWMIDSPICDADINGIVDAMPQRCPQMNHLASDSTTAWVSNCIIPMAQHDVAIGCWWWCFGSRLHNVIVLFLAQVIRLFAQYLPFKRAMHSTDVSILHWNDHRSIGKTFHISYAWTGGTPAINLFYWRKTKRFPFTDRAVLCGCARPCVCK